VILPDFVPAVPFPTVQFFWNQLHLFINQAKTMRKILLLGLTAVLMLASSGLWAQERVVSGRVTDAEDGLGLPGVNVVLEGTTNGTVTNVDGNYSLTLPSGEGTLVFTFVGMATQEVPINERSEINVVMAADVAQLTEVVVTALGLDREKASLGYATQEITAEQVTTVKDVNFMNSLSGKVAGVSIKRSNDIGGSTNVVVRGYKSLTGNNQALFVVDGIIMSNEITNTASQQTGRGGYDYGNAAMDINPNDIESINVLKGAAATALYGSRAGNGVIVITTKKGGQRKGLGINASFGTTFGTIDKSTFVRYQKEFGAGYGPYYATNGGYYDEFDLGDGSQLITPTYEDASYGGPLDGTMAYDWRSIFPQLSTYGQLFPQRPAENDASTFYETSRMLNTNISVEGGTERANYRLSYTNVDQNGVLPNSSITRNTVSFAGGYDVTDRINVSSVVNFTLTEAVGRYGTGYDNRNVNQSFRQWYQVTTDMREQRDAYESTGLNISWNPYGALDPDRSTRAHYFDNYYFNRFENYNSDERNRIFGNFVLDYKLTDWLTFTGRMSTDRYSELREERIAVGSVDVPMYLRTNRSFSENNLDLILRVNQDLGGLFSLGGLLGANYRRTRVDALTGETNGGLVVPGVYSLANSFNVPEAPIETSSQVGVDGYFAQVNLGFADMLYLDLTGRYDIASTLPEENSAFFYPSASLAFVFSEMTDFGFLSLGKIRLNYAEVGNLADPLLVNDIYVLNTPFAGTPMASASSIQRNPDLVSENTKSVEAGLELGLFKNRLSLDLSVYRTNSFNQIFRAEVTGATGRRTDIVNAGEIQNQGVEVSLRAVPISQNNFTWTLNVNWARNRNEVVSLFGDQTNLQLNNVQGGVTLNASVGQPFGTLRGSNFVYHTDGRTPIVYPFAARDGMRYRVSATPEIIGDINPDWIGGVQNILNFKGINLSFLIDMQRGGDFFSLDTWYGFATGIYDISGGNNRNGNSVRMDPSDGGGFYWSDWDSDKAHLQGVVETGADENGRPVSDGTPNTEAFWAGDYANSLGYAAAPNALHVYDASFVKLREVSIGYSLPASFISKTPFQGINISLIGRNLWIIHKNTPYSDPEAGLSAGNNLGNQSGAYPAVREYGFNIGLRL
jgi:TonB-linked SusC/RagA family outer membrane protein